MQNKAGKTGPITSNKLYAEATNDIQIIHH